MRVMNIERKPADNKVCWILNNGEIFSDLVNLLRYAVLSSTLWQNTSYVTFFSVHLQPNISALWF